MSNSNPVEVFPGSIQKWCIDQNITFDNFISILQQGGITNAKDVELDTTDNPNIFRCTSNETAYSFKLAFPEDFSDNTYRLKVSDHYTCSIKEFICSPDKNFPDKIELLLHKAFLSDSYSKLAYKIDNSGVELRFYCNKKQNFLQIISSLHSFEDISDYKSNYQSCIFDLETFFHRKDPLQTYSSIEAKFIELLSNHGVIESMNANSHTHRDFVVKLLLENT